MCAVIALLIVSCSKDDNEDNLTGEDLIIGQWKPVKDFELYNGVWDEYIYNDCDQKSRTTFEGNGKIKVTNFYSDEDSGNCIEDNYGFVSASWVKISEGSYKITSTYFDDYLGKNETTIETINVSFPTSNTLKITYSDTYYAEHSRVK